MEPHCVPSADLTEILWNRFNAQLRAFIRRRVGDEAAAEDVLQEVFVRIHAHVCGLRDRDRLESWLYQIARNAIVDHYRAQRETVELSETLAVDDWHEGLEGEDPARQLAGSLREIVEALPEPDRNALLLTEFQGLSQRDLAERLGLSISGAKSRVQRARAKVRDMLLACCHFDFDRRGAVIDYYEHCCCCAAGSTR